MLTFLNSGVEWKQEIFQETQANHYYRRMDVRTDRRTDKLLCKDYFALQKSYLQIYEESFNGPEKIVID